MAAEVAAQCRASQIQLNVDGAEVPVLDECSLVELFALIDPQECLDIWIADRDGTFDESSSAYSIRARLRLSESITVTSDSIVRRCSTARFSSGQPKIPAPYAAIARTAGLS